MAVTIEGWRYYANAWAHQDINNPVTDATAIGDTYRVCLKIKLPAVDSNKKRKSLKLNLNLLSSYFGSSSGIQVAASLTDTGPTGGGTKTFYGKEIDSKKVNVSTSSIYPKVEFTFDLNEEVPKTSTYLYIYLYKPSESYNYNLKIQSSSDVTIKETTETAIGAVGTGDITSSTGQIFKPNDTVTVKWKAGEDGANNTIASYTAYIKVGSAPTSASYTQVKTGISSSETSYTFTLTDAARGKEVHVGIQAIGTKSGYNGKLLTKNIGIINSLPSKPTVSYEGNKVAQTMSIKYTVTAGEDNNSSQNLTLYYSLNSGNKTKFTSPLTVNSSINNIKTGSNSIAFYTYDGKEYSSSTTFSFQADLTPIIKQVSCKHELVNNMSNELKLAVSTTINYSISGNSTGVEVYVRQNSTNSFVNAKEEKVSAKYYTFDKDKKQIIISVLDLPLITPGNYFQFRFKIIDGTLSSGLSSWQNSGRKPKQPRLPTYSSYNAHGNTRAQKGYYGNQVTISGSNPAADNAYAKISKVSIVTSYGKTTSEHASAIGSGDFNTNIKLTSVDPGTKTTFKFKVVDVAGQTTVGTSNFLTLTKAGSVKFSGNLINTNPASRLKPLSLSQDFNINHPIASATGSSAITFNYKIKIGSKEAALNVFDSPIFNDPNTVEVAITASSLRAVLESLVKNLNTTYSAEITVTAIDGFNITAFLKHTFTVDYRENPYFISTVPFKIRHDYDISSNSASGTIGVEVPTYRNKQDNNILMFNKDEGIIFAIPRAKDLNGDTDISKYYIYLSTNDFTGNAEVKSIQNVVFDTTPLLELSRATLEKNRDTNYYYYRYKTPQYSKNKYFYFKIQAVDSTGNKTQLLSCEQYIIGCRTLAPILTVEPITVSRNARGLVTIDYSSFKIKDLGGSATGTWNTNFYNNYPNFEREISGFSPYAQLTITIAADENFTQNVLTYTRNHSGRLLELGGSTITFENFSSSNSKIFIKFILTVRYSINGNGYATISSSPCVKTHFFEVPTVAHRSNKVGINTTNFGNNDVLVIENFKNKRIIVLRGAEDNNNNTITIDLATGTIDGIYINCGSW